MNDISRFFSKVNKTGGCWNWIGSKTYNGYGEFWDGRKKVLAHRHMAAMEFGEIPSGMFVCHRCDNPSCVNPEHLFIGSRSDNMLDAVKKGRHRFNASGLKLGHKHVPVGENHPSHKLTGKNVAEIRRTKKFHGRGKMLAKKFGVSEALITAVLKMNIWKHIVN